MKKSINLYDVYRKQQKVEKHVGAGATMLVITLMLGLIIGAYGLTLTLEKNSISKENAALMSDITSASKLEKYNEIQNLQARYDELVKVEDKIASVQTVLSEKNPITGSMIEQLYDAVPNCVVLNSVSINTPVAKLGVTFTCHKSLTTYIENLNSLSFVEYVENKQFSLVNEETSEYTTEIFVYLRGNY